MGFPIQIYYLHPVPSTMCCFVVMFVGKLFSLHVFLGQERILVIDFGSQVGGD